MGACMMLGIALMLSICLQLVGLVTFPREGVD